MKHALYVSQTGLSEPLAQSQILPYLRGLVRRGWTFDLVALEPHPVDRDVVEDLRRSLADEGIRYVPGMRSASHSKASKIVQIATLLQNATQLALRNRPRIIHARSDLSATVAVTLAKVVPGTKSIYDCRGFLADEYADFGHWSRASINYRGLRWTEQRLYRNADAVVTLTHDALRHLVDEVRWIPASTPTTVVPCCVDTARFAATDDARARTRTALGVGDDLLVAYVGTLGSWYCEAEMAALFAAIAARRASRLLVLTRASTERLHAALRSHGVPADRVIARAATPTDVPRLLAGSDIGISFAQPAFSKRASSPVKMGEYLAVGASLVLNRGVGDVDELLRERVCFDAGDLSSEALHHVADEIVATSFDADHRAAAVETAQRHFDLERVGIERYAALYDRLL